MEKYNPLPVKWNIILFTITLVSIIIDQLTKWWIQSNFYLGQSVPETGLFRLTYAQNTGAAFSIFHGQVSILGIFSAIGAIIILVYIFFISRHFPFLETRLNKVAIGLILGGVIGNGIDRLWLHYVRDFIDIGPWPIFNVADSCTTVGIIIFAASIIFLSRNLDSHSPQLR
jgi:signal peptidase II